MLTNHTLKFLFLTITILLLGSCKEVKDIKPEELKSDLRTGDIVFRRGISPQSDIVYSLDKNSIYSHIGMVLWHNNQWSIIHSVPNEAPKGEKDRVKIEKIEEFFSKEKSKSGAVYRMDLQAEDTIVLYDLSMEILKTKPLFDNSFSIEDTLSFYCTELVWHLYKKAINKDLTEKRRHKFPLFPPLILCSDIQKYPDLNPIFEY